MAAHETKPRPVAPELGWYSEALDRFMDQPDPWLNVFWPVLAAYAGLIVLGWLTCGVGAIGAILIPAMMAATARAMLIVQRGGPAASVNQLWAWSVDLFAPALIYHIIAGLLTALAFQFCLVPGFFVTGPWALGFFDVAEGRREYWAAFVEHIEACWPHVWEWVLFELVGTIISCLVITMPLVAMAHGIAYERMHAADVPPEAVSA